MSEQAVLVAHLSAELALSKYESGKIYADYEVPATGNTVGTDVFIQPKVTYQYEIWIGHLNE